MENTVYHYGHFWRIPLWLFFLPILKFMNWDHIRVSFLLQIIFLFRQFLFFFYFFAKTNMRHMHYQRKQMMNSNYQFIMAKVSLPSWANIEFSRTTKSSTVELILRSIDLIIDYKRWPLVRNTFLVIGLICDVNYKVGF